MTNQPLVSIITVVFNGEKHLQQTIDSVYNQTYKNIEYIIVDGKSTDNTINIIQNNKNKITKWISEPDKGLYDAMNKGISLANGQLIGTINSDDWYQSNAVELSVIAYINHPKAKIIHANRFDVYPNNTKKEFKFNPSAFKFLYFNMTYSHPTMFVVKEEYQKHKYSIKLKSSSDYQFILEAFLNDKNGFVHIPKPIVNFRLGGISAQLSFFDELKEAYLARKSAGMKTYKCCFALLLKFFLNPIVVLKRVLNKNS
ncbi:glycosyltransferase family 2 protein [uncultured Polaribacter sp.]|uniref:glycosyltransferase family 2 protein n=1 Tax=uncultured Polaribacter sp. TaxID=174711 RepID=UPI00262C78AC|nr:glycosyltransferase family 2 protein [uncultured Polaribacter sp.]